MSNLEKQSISALYQVRFVRYLANALSRGCLVLTEPASVARKRASIKTELYAVDSLLRAFVSYRSEIRATRPPPLTE